MKYYELEVDGEVIDCLRAEGKARAGAKVQRAMTPAPRSVRVYESEINTDGGLNTVVMELLCKRRCPVRLALVYSYEAPVEPCHQEPVEIGHFAENDGEE